VEAKQSAGLMSVQNKESGYEMHYLALMIDDGTYSQELISRYLWSAGMIPMKPVENNCIGYSAGSISSVRFTGYQSNHRASPIMSGGPCAAPGNVVKNCVDDGGGRCAVFLADPAGYPHLTLAA
jgi:hypothetical protein